MINRRSIKEILVGNVFFPFTNFLYNRKYINTLYRSYIKAEHYSSEQNMELQLKLLKRQVKYVEENVPYYQHLFNNIGFSSKDFNSLDDFSRIPPLSREDVVNNRHNLVDKNVAKYAIQSDNLDRGAGAPINFGVFKKNNIVRNISSGSTGAPAVFYENGSTTAQNWSNELRVNSWFGLKPGIRQARFVRFTTDYNFENNTNQIRLKLWNQLVLPGVNLQQKDYPWIIKKLLDFKPYLYWGFTTAITGLAEFIQENDIEFFHKPKLIVTWAAPLYEHEEALLRDVFQCEITNIYGTREVGHIGCRCLGGNMHVFQESIFLEQFNKSNNRSEPGELLATTLYRSVMPFIRFRTGDLGFIANSICSCGKNLPFIREFVGRTGEVFNTNDGRMISPNFWCRTFMDKNRSQAVKRFQVIYKKDGNIDILLVKTDKFDAKVEVDFIKYLNKNFGSETKIQLKQVNEIIPTTSGKYQMVIKEL